MNGAGNSFFVLEDPEGELRRRGPGALARQLCRPEEGEQTDGMIVIIPAEGDEDFGMLFYNADGSLGEMCGNGARCICRWGYEHGLAGDTQRVETTAGLVTGERIDRSRYRVRLNDPSVLDARTARVGDAAYPCRYAELGDPGIPHAVVLLDDWDARETAALRELGRALRFAPVFPKGANVSFVRVLGPDRLKAVTFERGVEDFTLACGTGCGAVAVSLILLGFVPGEALTVDMPGGQLQVRLHHDGDRVTDILLTGPTEYVEEGSLEPFL